MEIIKLPSDYRVRIEDLAARDDVRQAEVDDLFGSIRSREDAGELPEGATAEGWKLLDQLNAEPQAHKGVANLDKQQADAGEQSDPPSVGDDDRGFDPIRNRRG